MSNLQKLEFETTNLTERVAKEMSLYSQNVRIKLNRIADYKSHFDSAF